MHHPTRGTPEHRPQNGARPGQASDSLLPSFADHSNPLTVFRPRNVLDLPSERLVLILQEVFPLCGVPDPQLPRHICEHNRGKESHHPGLAKPGHSPLLSAGLEPPPGHQFSAALELERLVSMQAATGGSGFSSNHPDNQAPLRHRRAGTLEGATPAHGEVVQLYTVSLSLQEHVSGRRALGNQNPPN